MASPDIIDTEKLLAPISEESPTGTDIREDSSPLSPYQSIKSERAAARAAERNSVHDGDTNEADEHWRKVLTLAPEILSKHSKDLEIVSWLTEALVRRYGFQGLRDAFALTRGLVEQYWDNLYPMPDEDGIETRVAPLAGLNGEGSEGVLIAPIRKVPLTEGSDPGPFGFWQYQQALEAQRAPDEESRSSKIDKLGFSLEDIERAVNGSSDQYFIDLRDDISQCIADYRATSQLLDQHCGLEHAPPTRAILEVLEECLGAINHIARHKFPVPESDESNAEGSEASEATASGANPGAGGARGPINSREAALKQIQEVASYFRKAEPHSPLSYLLEKAVKWGGMTLEDLMAELIPDSSSRQHFSELTGVRNDD